MRPPPSRAEREQPAPSACGSSVGQDVLRTVRTWPLCLTDGEGADCSVISAPRAPECDSVYVRREGENKCCTYSGQSSLGLLQA
jgi:hypothetical protein